MSKVKASLSIRRIILLLFTVALIVTIACYGALVFSNWKKSANKTAERVANDVNESIYKKLYDFILTPYHINELNHKILKNKILNLADENQRNSFFAGVLETHSKYIYSFSFGTSNGEYYGARRNENGVIEIMKNNSETGGSSWYYSVNKDLTAGELVLKAGQFDPRTRAWYKSAAEAGAPVFSPIYKHFVMDDLTISAAWPVYSETGILEGVLGTHLLLSDVGTYLKDAVAEFNGTAFIIEKASNKLIGNSLGTANFTVLQDGTLERYELEDVNDIEIQSWYEQYIAKGVDQQVYEGAHDNYFIKTREINMSGVDWIILSVIPESYFMSAVTNSMYLAGIIGMLSCILVIVAFNLVMTKYLRPITSLLQVSNDISTGDLTERVVIVRHDEIGMISESFNKVADKMLSLIDNLEASVQNRTKDLEKTVLALDESRDELRLILDSAAEAIYGIDLNGNCTFCNKSCIRMLGYSDQSELLGKNMHRQIHHTRVDGSSFPIEDCRIIRAVTEGVQSHVDDEVFWRADGTSFEVEYFSYPQIKNGEIIGAVITFMDISERKQKEAEIEYLNCHDALTGLHNRRCFEENREKIDNPTNLPLSVIFGDINGLKMTNDIFGHAAGDELIKKSAEILQQVCRQNDVVARVGGDEFIILLPKTTGENAKKILNRIKSSFAEARVQAVKCSISLGLDTKHSQEQTLDEIMANAENAMYKDKMMNRKSINNDIIETIIDTLHTKSPRDKQHSINVSEMCSLIGIELQLNETEIRKLKRVGYLHDIGKIVLDDSLLTSDSMYEDEHEVLQQHAVVGYRILNLFDDTLDLAEYVYGHHERWDGLGYPRGLKGEQIPLLSRVISVVETYDRVLNDGKLSLVERKSAALEVIKNCSGAQFDPNIVELFIRVIGKNERVQST